MLQTDAIVKFVRTGETATSGAEWPRRTFERLERRGHSPPMNSGFTSSSNTVRCVCMPSRLKYYGCLCGAEMEQHRRTIAEAETAPDQANQPEPHWTS